MTKLRQIVLDTETTGLEPTQGHKIIEIGCVEMIDRRLTGNNFQQYLNPEREIDEGAVEVHGIELADLADKPRFAEIAGDFLGYVKGAELIIHNAAFDIGFLDHELGLMQSSPGKMADFCEVTDTLLLAREKHPGQRNSLDALCQRYMIDNAHRTLHGALLDSEILAEVYLAMTGGQLNLLGELGAAEQSTAGAEAPVIQRSAQRVLEANQAELADHEKWVEMLEKATESPSVWRSLQDR